MSLHNNIKALKANIQKSTTMPNLRNSYQRCSIKIGVLKNFAKFIEKHLCQSLLYNKVAGPGLQLY